MNFILIHPEKFNVFCSLYRSSQDHSDNQKHWKEICDGSPSLINILPFLTVYDQSHVWQQYRLRVSEWPQYFMRFFSLPMTKNLKQAVGFFRPMAASCFHTYIRHQQGEKKLRCSSWLPVVISTARSLPMISEKQKKRRMLSGCSAGVSLLFLFMQKIQTLPVPSFQSCLTPPQSIAVIVIFITLQGDFHISPVCVCVLPAHRVFFSTVAQTLPSPSVS